MENLDHYEGQILNGKLQGKGKLTSPKGIILEGNFKDGIPDGEVEITLPDGRVYQLVINDAKVIKKELIKGKKPVKPPHLNPFRGNPGVKSKPKGSIFFFPGLGQEDFND
jgi:hypothetical protein